MAIDLLALKEECRREAPKDWEATYAAIIARYAHVDLACYGLHVHGKHPVLRALAESHHVYLWSSLLEKWPQLLLVCPPEHGKTTVMRWHIEQWIGQQTEKVYGATGSTGAPSVDDSGLAPSALLVMNTALQAQKQCMAVANVIESNRRYQKLFPHVKPAPKWGWTKDTLYCQRPDAGSAQPDPTLQAIGYDGPIQGARVGLCVVDDLTDQKDARSEGLIQSQKEWHQGSLMDRVVTGGLKRDICTRWAKNDLAQMLMNSDTWHSAVLPIRRQLAAEEQPPIWPDAYPDYPWGSVLWPEQWPEERIDAYRKEKLMVEGSILWQLTFMCNPTDREGNLFRSNWFQYEETPYQFEGALAA